ncbi:hypothetical protein BDI4_660005 [Burkholderia diffusa]|nr:hypothetical protein BDI4_660005 [Burkholderia diffusa]
MSRRHTGRAEYSIRRFAKQFGELLLNYTFLRNSSLTTNVTHPSDERWPSQGMKGGPSTLTRACEIRRSRVPRRRDAGAAAGL